MHAHRLLGAFAAIAVVIAACASSTPGASRAQTLSAGLSGQSTQTSDGGQVTMAADWAGPGGGAVFDITLDTHSVDLDPLDLSDAILRNDRGETMTAQPWAAPKGGHHRRGALTFQGDAASFFAGATWIELVVLGVGDLPERMLRWEVGS